MSDLIVGLLSVGGGIVAGALLGRFLKGKKPPAPKSAWESIDEEIDRELDKRADK